MSDVLRKHIKKFIAINEKDFPKILSYFKTIEARKKYNLLTEGNKTSVMKSVFSACRIFSLCFFMVFVCSSCTSYLIVNGGQHVPKMTTIYVTGYDTATGHLALEDVSRHSADPFPVYPGQKIRWKISGIKHFLINNIVEKTVKAPGTEVFRNEPHPVKFFSRSWKGTLKDSTGLHGMAFEHDSSGHFINYIYKIGWRKAGRNHTSDPVIQIKLP